jgi:hypothetical protein
MARNIIAAVGLIVFIAAPVRPTAAQSMEDVAGTYILAGETREQNGAKTELPTKGSLSLDKSGRYMLTTFLPNLPKIASENRTTATPEENKAIVSGSLAHYGTYSIQDKTLIFKVERSSFPNWDGIEQRRPFNLSGDELKYTLGNASGGGSVTLTWKRVK